MEYSLIEYLWFFVIYSFLGWAIEVSFHAVTSGKFVNRGFLNGPVCPIYGFGMSILIFSLGSIVDNFILLFLGSIILTTLLEFITGFVLEKVFHDKWWDYSDRPFNIKGYVCLSFSILWGLAAVFMLNIIHPTIVNLMGVLDNKIGNIMIVILITYFIADFIVTVAGIVKINKRSRVLNEMAAQLKLYSDHIGEDIYETMTNIIETKDAVSRKVEDSKSKFEAKLENRKTTVPKLEKEYKRLLKNKPYVHKRLEKAYPNIRKRLAELEKDRKDK